MKCPYQRHTGVIFARGGGIFAITPYSRTNLNISPMLEFPYVQYLSLSIGVVRQNVIHEPSDEWKRKRSKFEEYCPTQHI